MMGKAPKSKEADTDGLEKPQTDYSSMADEDEFGEEFDSVDDEEAADDNTDETDEIASETPEETPEEVESKGEGEEAEEPEKPEPEKETKPEETPETPEEQPAEEPSPESQVSEEERAKQIDDWRAGVVDALAESHYTLSEEETDELENNAGKIIPKIMARVHVDAYLAAMNGFTQAFPALLEQHTRSRERYESDERRFMETWPKLDIKSNDAHRNTVMRIGAAYRQMNPTASAEDFIREVGAQAHIALRIPLEDTEEPAAPRQEPFKPAGVSAPAPEKKLGPENKFAKMVEEEMIDDT